MFVPPKPVTTTHGNIMASNQFTIVVYPLLLLLRIMTRDTSDSSDDRKEAASFFSKWMSTENKGEGWDEVCFQWCKQKSAARKENVDPNCSMLCFNRPVSENLFDSNDKWNPLKGYTVTVVSGKNECTSHTNGNDKLDIFKEFL